MMVWQTIVGSATGAAALLLGVYASFTARKKGPIFSNTFIWGSAKEKENADKAAEYRLVTVVSGCLAVFFALDTVYVFTLNGLPL